MNLPSLKQAKIRGKEEVKILYDDYKIPDDVQNYFKNKKYYIETYGCQMNVHDSENIKAILENIGLTETASMTNSDLIILNTCAIRENAHNKVFGMLGRIKHLKEEKKDSEEELTLENYNDILNNLDDNEDYIDAFDNIVYFDELGVDNDTELEELTEEIYPGIRKMKK